MLGENEHTWNLIRLDSTKHAMIHEVGLSSGQLVKALICDQHLSKWFVPI
jgi:hypothetical protein